MKLEQNELELLKNYYEYFNENKILDYDIKNKSEIIEIIVISCGQELLHDSGYPYIICIGVTEDRNNFYNLGLKDHILTYGTPVNIDSLGKNIYRIMNFNRSKPWSNLDYGSCSLILRNI